LYVRGNPINLVDRLGFFDDKVIEGSLAGKSVKEAFGVERYGAARWGLYYLLKDAQEFGRITLRWADFGYSGIPYPLAPDPAGPWIVHSWCGNLLFFNPSTGPLTLNDFLSELNSKSEAKTSLSYKWWRPATLQYHWYELNSGKFYSDFYNSTQMPDLFVIGAAPRALGGVSLLFVQDRYGNQYYSVSGSGGLSVGLAEAWEGYATLTANVPLSRRFSEQLGEVELRQVIEGWSIGATASIITAGGGISFWRVGGIGLFGGLNGVAGISFSMGYTWYVKKDFTKAWSWVDEDIPMYGPLP
ncbi:MAG: hypothetical protein AB1589_44780, partial [Cyanobacteriota bacterium]